MSDIEIWKKVMAICTGQNKDIVDVVNNSGGDPRNLIPLYEFTEEYPLPKPLDRILQPKVFSDVALQLDANPEDTAATLQTLMELRLQRPDTVFLSPPQRWMKINGQLIAEEMEQQEFSYNGEVRFSTAFKRAFENQLRD